MVFYRADRDGNPAIIHEPCAIDYQLIIQDSFLRYQINQSAVIFAPLKKEGTIRETAIRTIEMEAAAV
ncbi:MAG TPA: hypothetical protein VEX65_11895, partial [Flavisolibacter sp.]|nr:hypothetical protein [Flavisolibacter sp.]